MFDELTRLSELEVQDRTRELQSADENQALRSKIRAIVFPVLEKFILALNKGKEWTIYEGRTGIYWSVVSKNNHGNIGEIFLRVDFQLDFLICNIPQSFYPSRPIAISERESGSIEEWQSDLANVIEQRWLLFVHRPK